MVHQGDLEAFHLLLSQIAAPGRRRPPRILALCGAGLSAASGLPTFRGATGALWEKYDPMTLATPEAFRRDPVLSWRFYAYRRTAALRAQPNAGHRALAALAWRYPGFLCLTQTVDGKGLSPRAGHPPGRLRALHGSLFDLRCSSRGCGYVERDNRQDPLCAALRSSNTFNGAATGAAAGKATSTEARTETSTAARTETSTETTAPSEKASAPPPPPPPQLQPAVADLPHCPACRASGRSSLLRPGVVWFGESLDQAMLREVDAWIAAGSVDLMLVVGTSAEVYPAAGFVDKAREAGAVVATVNLDAESLGSLAGMQPPDFAFGGDAAELLPQMLGPMIGQPAYVDVGDSDGDGGREGRIKAWFESDGEDSS